MHRTSVSLRAVAQRALAVAGLSALVLSGSAAVASAVPHFSTTGPLTVTTGGGPFGVIYLYHTSLPDVGLNCSNLQLGVASASNSPVAQVANITFSPSTLCSGSDGYTYTVTATSVPSALLQYNGTNFFFTMSNVTWKIDGGPMNSHRTFKPAPYNMYWLNTTPKSRLMVSGTLGVSTPGASYWDNNWTGSFAGTWGVTQNGNPITALL